MSQEIVSITAAAAEKPAHPHSVGQGEDAASFALLLAAIGITPPPEDGGATGAATAAFGIEVQAGRPAEKPHVSQPEIAGSPVPFPPASDGMPGEAGETPETSTAVPAAFLALAAAPQQQPAAEPPSQPATVPTGGAVSPAGRRAETGVAVPAGNPPAGVPLAGEAPPGEAPPGQAAAGQPPAAEAGPETPLEFALPTTGTAVSAARDPVGRAVPRAAAGGDRGAAPDLPADAAPATSGPRAGGSPDETAKPAGRASVITGYAAPVAAAAAFDSRLAGPVGIGSEPRHTTETVSARPSGQPEEAASAVLPGPSMAQSLPTAPAPDAAGREYQAVLPGRERVPPAGIAPAIRSLAVSGTGEATLRLEPEWLGALDVRIEHSLGRLSVTLSTATPEARDMLQSMLPQLRSALESQGYSVDRLALTASGSFGLGNPGWRGEGGHSGGGPGWQARHQSTGGFFRTEAAWTPGNLRHGSLLSVGAIDYRV